MREPSQITGTVASLPAQGTLSFGLATLPLFFVPPAAVWGGVPSYASPFIITIDTPAATIFSNFATDSLSGLAVDDVVSVHGWVFAAPTGMTSVTLAADAVMDRPAPIPLF